MKAKLTDLIFRLGVFKLVAPLSRGLGSILMLHEVHADDSLAIFDGCTASQLDRALDALRRWNIDLIAMDDLLPRLRSNNRRQFVVITLDDGYRDNLENALPIFERHQVPILINVPTGAVTRELYCWWIGLRELFMTRDTLRLPTGQDLDIGTRDAKLREYRRLQHWLAEDFMRADTLRPWFEAEGLSFPVLADRFFMNEGELRRCGAHPLVTIGAHSNTHRPLASLPEQEMRSELTENKAFLEAILQKPVDHFAYPYGGKAQCGPREALAARETGFKTAIAVRHGQLTASSVDTPFLLPREDIGYHGMTERQLYGVANGFYGLRAGLMGS